MPAIGDIFNNFAANVERWVQSAVYPKLDNKMRSMGRLWEDEARRLCPVDTGQLRDSIGFYYDQKTRTLTLYADKSYAAFVEFGTRYRRAEPFMRPAMRMLGNAWGVTIRAQMTMVPKKYHARTYVYTHKRLGPHKLHLGHFPRKTA